MASKEAGEKHMLCKNREFFVKLAEDGKDTSKKLHKELRLRRREMSKDCDMESGEDELDFDTRVSQARWFVPL